MTNSEVINSFIDYITIERRYSPLTVRNYRHDVEQFLAWGEASAEEGRFSLLAVRGEELREWIMHLSAKRDGGGARLYTAASVNRAVATLRSMYKFLRRKGHLSVDVFAGVKASRTSRRLPAYVPESRLESVVERVESDITSDEYIVARNALIVYMLCACGLRLAELVAIDVGDFSSDFRSLTVRGKGDKERIVPIVERLRGQIKSYADRFLSPEICKKAENALILSKRGERISRSDVQRSVARLLQECGVQGKSSPHILRHTFATHLLNNGADIREIQELLGHSSLRATQVYTHNSISRLQRVYIDAHPREKSE